MATPTLPELLLALGDQLGIPDLALDEQNTCSMSVDELYSVDIQWQPEASRLHLVTVVSTLPPPEQQTLTYRLLMEANLFGMATGGAYFAASEALGEVLLIRTLEAAHLDLVQLMQALDDFVPAVKFWTQRLAHGVSAMDLAPTGTSAATIIIHP